MKSTDEFNKGRPIGNSESYKKITNADDQNEEKNFLEDFLWKPTTSVMLDNENSSNKLKLNEISSTEIDDWLKKPSYCGYNQEMLVMNSHLLVKPENQEKTSKKTSSTIKETSDKDRKLEEDLKKIEKWRMEHSRVSIQDPNLTNYLPRKHSYFNTDTEKNSSLDNVSLLSSFTNNGLYVQPLSSGCDKDCKGSRKQLEDAITHRNVSGMEHKSWTDTLENSSTIPLLSGYNFFNDKINSKAGIPTYCNHPQHDRLFLERARPYPRCFNNTSIPITCRQGVPYRNRGHRYCRNRQFIQKNADLSDITENNPYCHCPRINNNSNTEYDQIVRKTTSAEKRRIRNEECVRICQEKRHLEEKARDYPENPTTTNEKRNLGEEIPDYRENPSDLDKPTTSNVNEEEPPRNYDQERGRNDKKIRKKRYGKENLKKSKPNNYLCCQSGEVDKDELSSDREQRFYREPKKMEYKEKVQEKPILTFCKCSDYNFTKTKRSLENYTECWRLPRENKEEKITIIQQPLKVSKSVGSLTHHPMATDSFNVGKNITIQIIPNCNNHVNRSHQEQCHLRGSTKIVRDYDEITGEDFERTRVYCDCGHVKNPTMMGYCACGQNIHHEKYGRRRKKHYNWWKIGPWRRVNNSRRTHTTRDFSVNTNEDCQLENCQRVLPISDSYIDKPSRRYYRNYDQNDNRLFEYAYRLNKKHWKNLFATPCPSASLACPQTCPFKIQGAPHPVCAYQTSPTCGFPQTCGVLPTNQLCPNEPNAICQPKDELLNLCMKYLTKKMTRYENDSEEEINDNCSSCHHSCCCCNCQKQTKTFQQSQKTYCQCQEKTTATSCLCTRCRSVQTKKSTENCGTNVSCVQLEISTNTEGCFTPTLPSPKVESRKKRCCRSKCCKCCCCVSPRCCQCEPNIRSCLCQCQPFTDTNNNNILEKFIEILKAARTQQDVKSCQYDLTKSSVKSTNTLSQQTKTIDGTSSSLTTKLINHVTLDLCSLANKNFSKFGVPSQYYHWSISDTFLRSMRKEVLRFVGNNNCHHLIEDSAHHDPTPCLEPVKVDFERCKQQKSSIDACGDIDHKNEKSLTSFCAKNNFKSNVAVSEINLSQVSTLRNEEEKKKGLQSKTSMKNIRKNTKPQISKENYYSSIKPCTTRTGLMSFMPPFRETVRYFNNKNRNDKKEPQTTKTIKSKKENTNNSLNEKTERIDKSKTSESKGGGTSFSRLPIRRGAFCRKSNEVVQMNPAIVSLVEKDKWSTEVDQTQNQTKTNDDTNTLVELNGVVQMYQSENEKKQGILMGETSREVLGSDGFDKEVYSCSCVVAPKEIIEKNGQILNTMNLSNITKSLETNKNDQSETFSPILSELFQSEDTDEEIDQKTFFSSNFEKKDEMFEDIFSSFLNQKEFYVPNNKVLSITDLICLE